MSFQIRCGGPVAVKKDKLEICVKEHEGVRRGGHPLFLVK
jgi:hypothetical protein